jgi:hypothetical protein
VNGTQIDADFNADFPAGSLALRKSAERISANLRASPHLQLARNPGSVWVK